MPAPRTVLLLSDFVPPVRGGLEQHVVSLAAALADRGDQVHVGTLIAEADLPDPRLSVHVLGGRGIHLLPHLDPTRPFHPPWPDPGTRAQLNRLLRAIRPDVIHVHSPIGLSLPRNRPATVFTAHDYWLTCPRRTLLLRGEVVCDGPRALKCTACQRGDSGLPKAIANDASRYFGPRRFTPEVVIAVSEAVRRRIQRPSRVIPNFIPDRYPTSHTHPARSGGADDPYVVFAGDPGSHKGLPQLLQWWREAGPNAPCRLLVLTTRSIDVPLPPRVTGASGGPDEVRRAMQAAVAVVVPSAWLDPSPTVILEAMSVGTPVVASNIGGIPDMVVDHEHGLLCRPGDGVALLAAVRTLVHDRKLRERFGRAAAERAKRFRASSVVPLIEAAYDDATELWRSTSPDSRASTRPV